MIRVDTWWLPQTKDHGSYSRSVFLLVWLLASGFTSENSLRLDLPSSHHSGLDPKLKGTWYLDCHADPGMDLTVIGLSEPLSVPKPTQTAESQRLSSINARALNVQGWQAFPMRTALSYVKR